MNVIIFHTMLNQLYYQLIIPDAPHFEEYLCQVEEGMLVIDAEDRDHGKTTPGTGEYGRDKATPGLM